MKKLQWYILKRFLLFLIIFTVGAIFLFVIVNFFETIDHFVQHKTGIILILEYYGLQIGYIFNLMFPVGQLLAIFVIISEFARKNELLAVKASGISLIHLFMPIIMLGAVNSVLDFTVAEYLGYPGFNKSRVVNRVKIEKRPPIFGRRFARELSFFWKNRLYFFGYITRRTNTADNITILDFSKQGKLVRRIDAKKGQYRDKHWILEQGTERAIGKIKDSVSTFSIKVYPELDISPFEFLTRTSDILYMTARDLKSLIKKKKKAGISYTAELVEYYTRYTFPISCFIMLLFSLSLSALTKSRAKAAAFGLALATAFIYWGVFQGAKLLGQIGKLNPVTASLTADVIFLIPGIFMFLRMDK